MRNDLDKPRVVSAVLGWFYLVIRVEFFYSLWPAFWGRLRTSMLPVVTSQKGILAKRGTPIRTLNNIQATASLAIGVLVCAHRSITLNVNHGTVLTWLAGQILRHGPVQWPIGQRFSPQ